MSIAGGGRLVGEVQYNSFLALLCSHDAEWSRQHYGEGERWYAPFLKPEVDLRNDCALYGDAVSKNFASFCKANRVQPAQPMEGFLYDPLCYLPLGHADVLSITLLDDFDPLHHLTARMRTTLENACLGFAPVLNSLGVTHEQETICELPEIWKLKNGAVGGELPPMLVFCKLKMHGFGALGLGLEFQVGVWRAMAARIGETMGALRAGFCGKGVEGGRVPVRSSDIEGARCCLLDLMGGEEVGLLVFCSNPTVAFSIVAGIRNLTCGNVFEAHPKVVGLFERSALHQRLGRCSRAQTGGSPGSAVRGPTEHPVFRWSHSSVGVLPAEFFGSCGGRLFPPAEKFGGFLCGTTNFQVAPGHSQPGERTKTDGLKQGRAEEPRFKDLGENFESYVAGLYDCELRHGEEGMRVVDGPILGTGTLIDNLEGIIRRLCLSGRLRAGIGRDVVDLETDLIIPIPKLKSREGEELTFLTSARSFTTPLSSALPEVVNRLCYFSKLGPEAMEAIRKRVSPREPGGLDISALMDAQRQLGVPVSLRRTIEYMFRNFAIITSDPFLFDVLLDLYDVFATLHAVITQHLPKVELGRCEGVDAEGRQLLDEERVRCLSEIIGALHNAVIHRTAQAFRDSPWRDMAVDFRGGLNQILIAADAPVKCGLGVLRRFAFKNDLGDSRSRDRVGCFMRVGVTPGARCCKTNFGTEDKARLAFFDADVPHVMHPASYADFLHEAFHLVFDAVVPQDQAWKEGIEGLNQADLVRLEEVFALMLWKMFVFEDDTESFLYHSLLSFSRDIASVGANDRENCRRFTEVLLRLFFAVDVSRGQTGDPRFWPENCESSKCAPLDAVETRFKEMIKDAGPFFSEYNRLWADDPHGQAWMYTMNRFRVVHDRIADLIPTLYRKAAAVYRKTVEGTFPANDRVALSKTVADIEAQIEVGLREGHPLIWGGFTTEAKSRGGEQQEAWVERNLSDVAIDPLQFVCKILRLYIGTIKRAKGKNIHLMRGGPKAKLSYEGQGPMWDFQADKGAAELFSCVPAARRGRLLKQIVVIKSFWDLASEFRARRLLDMLLSNDVQ